MATYTPVNYAPKPCTYCGEVFKPKQKRSIKCDSEACRKEHNRVKMRESYKRWSDELGYSYHARPNRNRTTYKRECRRCGAGFETKTGITEYCTHACAMGARQEAPGYYGEGACSTCGGTFPRSAPTQTFCSPECRPTPKPKPKAVPKDMRSPLRKGYEDNDKELFFSALKSDCNINQETGCWEWTRQSKEGYARASVGKKPLMLHRASLEMHEGKPLGVLAAHHKCANTICVNPEHLEPATAADNTVEMIARNSFIARIEELENALKEINPGHEILNRIAAT